MPRKDSTTFALRDNNAVAGVDTIHKASNRAFVWWRDKQHYLGTANSHESLEAYNRFIAEIARTKGLFNPTEKAEPSDPSKRSVLVVDLMAAYLTKVESELSKKEFENICYSFRPLRKLFGHTLVDQFGWGYERSEVFTLY